MAASLGQSAQSQAKAFKNCVPVGGVIVTKLDGAARGGGAIRYKFENVFLFMSIGGFFLRECFVLFFCSAVASTQSPIVFLGSGEDLHALQEFDVKGFVGRLLGKGDLKGIMNLIQNAIPKQKTIKKR